MQSKIAHFGIIKAIGTSSSDRQLLRTDHQFRIRLDNPSSSNRSKADNKLRIRMLILPSKIEMYKGDRIKHRTSHSNKGGHIISIVWMQTLQGTWWKVNFLFVE